jgi:hypothetical protein
MIELRGGHRWPLPAKHSRSFKYMETRMNISREFPRRSLLQFAGASVAATFLPAAIAQRGTEPLNLAKITLGSPAGTLMDLFARRIADAIQPAYARFCLVQGQPDAGQLWLACISINLAFCWQHGIARSRC